MTNWCESACWWSTPIGTSAKRKTFWYVLIFLLSLTSPLTLLRSFFRISWTPWTMRMTSLLKTTANFFALTSTTGKFTAPPFPSHPSSMLSWPPIPLHHQPSTTLQVRRWSVTHQQQNSDCHLRWPDTGGDHGVHDGQRHRRFGQQTQPEGKSACLKPNWKSLTKSHDISSPFLSTGSSEISEAAAWQELQPPVARCRGEGPILELLQSRAWMHGRLQVRLLHLPRVAHPWLLRTDSIDIEFAPYLLSPFPSKSSRIHQLLGHFKQHNCSIWAIFFAHWSKSPWPPLTSASLSNYLRLVFVAFE